MPKSLTHKEYCWTWSNQAEYSLMYPMWRKGQTPLWHIMADGQTLSSGRIEIPSIWDQLRPTAKVQVTWQLDREILLKESTWCAARLIRQSDGRRYAVWNARLRGFEGVWRNGLVKSDVPLVFGMILASVCNS
ncbi:MAG TPA: hypothetical protein VMP01_22470 [Pirellulaceae bacterium]|nr:hypothetical protein [Pirellulaceae bacterium]